MAGDEPKFISNLVWNWQRLNLHRVCRPRTPVAMMR